MYLYTITKTYEHTFLIVFIFINWELSSKNTFTGVNVFSQILKSSKVRESFPCNKPPLQDGFLLFGCCIRSHYIRRWKKGIFFVSGWLIRKIQNRWKSLTDNTEKCTSWHFMLYAASSSPANLKGVAPNRLTVVGVQLKLACCMYQLKHAKRKFK